MNRAGSWQKIALHPVFGAPFATGAARAGRGVLSPSVNRISIPFRDEFDYLFSIGFACVCEGDNVS
jgi:hypothetical protein